MPVLLGPPAGLPAGGAPRDATAGKFWSLSIFTRDIAALLDWDDTVTAQPKYFVVSNRLNSVDADAPPVYATLPAILVTGVIGAMSH